MGARAGLVAWTGGRRVADVYLEPRCLRVWNTSLADTFVSGATICQGVAVPLAWGDTPGGSQVTKPRRHRELVTEREVAQ